jgi:iron complex outermembrane recepter protein
MRLSFLLMLLSPLALAAEPTLAPILISGGRTTEPSIDIPTSAIVIDREAIENSGADGIADLLRRVAGVHVADGVGGGGSARIDMRGFGSSAASNVAILIDGRKINPATDSSTLYLNSIDLGTVERIEIIEGSAGTLYGNQAVGGLINVITRRPSGNSATLGLGAGSYDAWQTTLSASHAVDPDVNVSLHLDRRDSDNYRDRNAGRVQRLRGRIDVDHAGGSSFAELTHLVDQLETPGALLADELAIDRRQAVFDDDYIDTESLVITLGTRRQLSEAWRLEGEFSIRDDERKFRQSFRGFATPPGQQDRSALEITPRLIGQYGSTLVTLGLDHLATDYRLTTGFGPQDNDQQINAVYAQLSRPVSDSVTLTAGLRHARVTNDIFDFNGRNTIDDDVTVGSLGAVWRPRPGWRLFLRADQNYRFAKVDEHTNPVFGQPVGLDTQTGVSYETGIEYGTRHARIAARAYQLRLDDEISFDSSGFANINLPDTRRNGIALSVDLQPDPALGFGASLAFIDAEIRSGPNAGSHVPLVPRRRANLYAEARPAPGWFLRLDAEYVDEQYLGADWSNSADPLDAYTVVDLTAHYDTGNWRLTARIRNLLDRQYVESGNRGFADDGFNPAPERNLWIGATYRFGG